MLTTLRAPLFLYKSVARHLETRLAPVYLSVIRNYKVIISFRYWDYHGQLSGADSCTESSSVFTESSLWSPSTLSTSSDITSLVALVRRIRAMVCRMATSSRAADVGRLWDLVTLCSQYMVLIVSRIITVLIVWAACNESVIIVIGDLAWIYGACHHCTSVH